MLEAKTITVSRELEGMCGKLDNNIHRCWRFLVTFVRPSKGQGKCINGSVEGGVCAQ